MATNSDSTRPTLERSDERAWNAKAPQIHGNLQRAHSAAKPLHTGIVPYCFDDIGRHNIVRKNSIAAHLTDELGYSTRASTILVYRNIPLRGCIDKLDT